MIAELLKNWHQLSLTFFLDYSSIDKQLLSSGKGASIGRFVGPSIGLSVCPSVKKNYDTQILAKLVQKGASINELKCWDYLLIQVVSLQLHSQLIAYPCLLF